MLGKGQPQQSRASDKENLPPGWREARDDESGNAYYYHAITRKVCAWRALQASPRVPFLSSLNLVHPRWRQATWHWPPGTFPIQLDEDEELPREENLGSVRRSDLCLHLTPDF